MKIIPSDRCVQCVIKPWKHTSMPSSGGEVEVFYGFNNDLSSRYQDLESNLSVQEKERAGKFLFFEDRQTYVLCHGFLRLILSREVRVNPNELIFRNDINNKPWLIGSPCFFNITHDRGAFAIAISKHFYLGIDIENTGKSIDFKPLMKSNFSASENRFILDHASSSKDRFFLLWTRKEALLKSLGTGIINDLTHLEVSESRNLIPESLFGCELDQTVNHEHFIYSEIVSGYYLSVAIPRKENIKLTPVDEAAVDFYMSK